MNDSSRQIHSSFSLPQRNTTIIKITKAVKDRHAAENTIYMSSNTEMYCKLCESRRAISSPQSSTILSCGDHHILVEMTNDEKKGHKFCRVCRLEESLMKKKNIKVQNGCGSRRQKYLYRCVTCSESYGKDIFLHKSKKAWGSTSKIFDIEPFAKMTCEEIYHSDQAKDLWDSAGIRVSIKTGHLIYTTLTDLWANELVGKDSDSADSDSE